jgi:hypothetical protein
MGYSTCYEELNVKIVFKFKNAHISVINIKERTLQTSMLACPRIIQPMICIPSTASPRPRNIREILKWNLKQ